jgi:hypothetical protein
MEEQGAPQAAGNLMEVDSIEDLQFGGRRLAI